MPKISIIGCGWLGRPLSENLKKSYDVECFSRETTEDDSVFWQADTFIIAINTKDNYLNTLQKISTLTKASANIILTSSTSVYREFDEEVNEEALITKRALQIEAEELVQDLRKETLVLRLGGLMGDGRVAGRCKKVSTFSDGPVNYIHQADVIKIIKEFIDKKITKGVFNLVSPEHPLRSQVHKRNSEKYGFTLGTFEGETHKIVSSEKMIKQLGYTFIYPNPLDF